MRITVAGYGAIGRYVATTFGRQHEIVPYDPTKGLGRRSVVINLKGWRMGEPRLPEMTLPTDEELAAGYEGELWMATKGDWKLEVVWRGDYAKYRCQAVRFSDPDNPAESRTFDYPHEVVDWISVWNMQLVGVR